jgi:hypothetical protein
MSVFCFTVIAACAGLVEGNLINCK